MSGKLTKQECLEILPFANALRNGLHEGKCSTGNLSTFISVVKEILKENQKQNGKPTNSN